MSRSAWLILLAGSLFLFCAAKQSDCFASEQHLTDLTGYWGEPYVQALAERGIVAGFPDGTFKPNDQVTRAQFAAMVTRAFELQDGSGGNVARFSDVKESYWGSKAIASVSAAGMVSGFPDGTYHPDDKITRAQGLVILAKALPEGKDLPEALSRYKDPDAVPGWASKSLSHAATQGIIVNFPDAAVIQPNSLATRGELAAMTYQTMAAKGAFPRLDIGALPLLRPMPITKIKPKLVPLSIVSLDLLSGRLLKAGQQLQVGLTGTPGGHAFFRISQIGETIEMQEVAPGKYKGAAEIVPGEHANNANVHATLMTPDGQHADKTSDWNIVLEGSGPVVTNVSPLPDSLVASRTPTIKAVFAEPGGINPASIKMHVNGQDVTLQSAITANSIAFRSLVPLPGNQVHVAVFVADLAGNKTQQRWMFFLQAPIRPYPMHHPAPPGYYSRPPLTPAQEVEQGVKREVNQLLK